MTATVEETQSDLPALIQRAALGEEVLITQRGRPVARLLAVSDTPKPSQEDKRRWLDELDRLRQTTSTGKTGTSIEQILAEGREDRF